VEVPCQLERGKGLANLEGTKEANFKQKTGGPCGLEAGKETGYSDQWVCDGVIRDYKSSHHDSRERRETELSSKGEERRTNGIR